jgi:hypothetical protein
MNEGTAFEHKVACPIGTYSTGNVTNSPRGLNALAECTKCPIGRSTNSTNSTSLEHCVCDKGYYTIHGSSPLTDGRPGHESGCKTCDDGLKCDKTNLFIDQVSVNPGFYSAVDERKTLLQSVSCPFSEACSGGSNTCKEGHIGFLCAQCNDTYFNNGTLIAVSCVKCASTETDLIIQSIFFVIGLLLCAILFLFLVYRRIKKIETEREKDEVVKVDKWPVVQVCFKYVCFLYATH